MSVSSLIWWSLLLVDAAALAASLRSRAGRGLRILGGFFFLLIAGNIAEHVCLLEFGVNSRSYANVYFAADLVYTVVGYFVLARLVELAFEESTLKLPGLRTGAIFVFTGLAACSAAIVYFSRGSLNVPRFSIAMEQNFSFLGMILAILLFMGINVMQVPGVRFRRVVLSFSVMYSAGAITYAVLQVIPATLHVVGFYLLPLTTLASAALMAWSLWMPEATEREALVKAPLGLTPMAGRS